MSLQESVDAPLHASGLGTGNEIFVGCISIIEGAYFIPDQRSQSSHSPTNLQREEQIKGKPLELSLSLNPRVPWNQHWRERLNGGLQSSVVQVGIKEGTREFGPVDDTIWTAGWALLR